MFSLFSFKKTSVQGRHLWRHPALHYVDVQDLSKYQQYSRREMSHKWPWFNILPPKIQPSLCAGWFRFDLDLLEEERTGKMWCLSYLPINMGLPSSSKPKILYWALSQIYWTLLEKAVFRDKTEFSLPSYSTVSERNISILTKTSKQHMGCLEHFHKMTTLNWFLALRPQKLEQQHASTFLPP